MSAKKTDTGFWDASAIVPLCCSQPALTVLSRRFAKQFSRKIAWWGTGVEIYSALNRLYREDKLDEKQFEKACRRWETLSQVFYFVEPTEKVREIAKTLPKAYGLRALDSFQLAAALVWCKEKPRNRIFVCYDRNLAEAARELSFTVKGWK